MGLPLVALLALVATFGTGGAAAVIDRASGRIPNALLAAGTSVVVGMMAAEAIATSPSHAVGALVGVLVVGAPLFFIAVLTNRRALGGGDVKLAALFGMSLGFVDAIGPKAMLGCTLLAWIVLAMRPRRGERFVFGPAVCTAGCASLALLLMIHVAGVQLSIFRPTA